MEAAAWSTEITPSNPLWLAGFGARKQRAHTIQFLLKEDVRHFGSRYYRSHWQPRESQ